MKISLINGSPKVKNSCSEYLLSEVKNLISEDNEIGEFNARGGVLPLRSLEELYNSDILVFAFPLYVDSLPSHFLRFLESLENYFTSKGRKSIKVYGICNCGFYEASQTTIALKILENWCNKCGLVYAQGLGVGGGPTFVNFTTIKLGQGPKKSLGIAVNELCKNIINEEVNLNLYTTINFPKRLYIYEGNKSWTIAAKQNGLKKRDIYSLR